MLMKVSDLTGAALDYVVAQCNETVVQVGSSGTVYCLIRDNLVVWAPSNNWAQGGPIIERESMTLTPFDDKWEARCKSNIPLTVKFIERRGPTPLIAAMRCYVASRLGDTINLEEQQ